MTVLLAIDSGGPVFSAALWANGVVIQQASVEKAPHSEQALPAVRQVLEAAGMTLAQCDAFAFGEGPGRFSGLRLACGLVQAFAYVYRRPVVAVPSLAALAQANYGTTVPMTYTALPAHRGHVYLALCQRLDGVWRTGRSRLSAVINLSLDWRRRHCCGEGFIRYLPTVEMLTVTAPYPTAAAVAAVAADMLAHDETVDALMCTPVYIRNHVAQTIIERQRISGV